MTSLTPLSSLCLSQNPNGNNSFRFTSKTSPRFRFVPQNFHRLKANKFPRVPLPVCRVSKVIFPNLQADDFRHPLDEEHNRPSEAAPDMNEYNKVVRDCFAGGTKLTENICIGTSVLATPSQLSSLHKLMAETAEILNVKAPLLYVRSSPVPCARSIPTNGTPSIVVHTSLLELLTLQELQAVFAHELAHLKCEHYAMLKTMDMLGRGAMFCQKFFGSQEWLVSPSALELVVRSSGRWRQGAAFSCDRASLLVVQNPKVVISVIMKLAGGSSSSLIQELKVDAFLAQARAYVRSFSSNPARWYSDAGATQITYPDPVVRAYEIDEWSRSKEYKTLVRSAKNKCGKEVDAEQVKKQMMDDVEKNMAKVNAKKIVEQAVADYIMEQLDAKKINFTLVVENKLFGSATEQADVENLVEQGEVDVEQVAAKMMEKLGRSKKNNWNILGWN